MASQLKVDTITGVTTAGSVAVTGEGNSTTTNLQQGLTKVWYVGDMSGGAMSATDSFNISGFTDVAEGIHGPSFTNNFRANKAYGFAGAHGHNVDVTDLNYTQQCHNNNDFVTGSCEIVSAYGHATTQGIFDYAYVTNQFVGDLA